MENLGVSISANLDQLNAGISTAIAKVQGFGKAVEGLPAPKLPTPQLGTAELNKVLDSLDAKLRVAQGNVELFGNQFQADRLKIVAYQQALNQLLAQGVSPTSKEVLNLANNIELLGKKTERQQAILERQAAKAAQAFKPQEGILQNLQRNIDLYRQKMQRATDTKSIENYRQTIQNLEVQVKRLSTTGVPAIQGVTNAAGRLSGSANQVGMEFARIIQDAPYGMQGIGNNIQQLTANFGQLRAQAGSTGAALRGAIAGILSPMSLVTIGISALTAGWVLYEKWQQKAAKETKKVTEAIEEAEKATQDYIKALDGVSRSRIKGEQDAQKELSTLRLLYNQTQNTSLSLKVRKDAVEDLQKQWPSYFGNLSTEAILNGKSQTSYEALAKTIIATAKARSYADQIAENASKNRGEGARLKSIQERIKLDKEALQIKKDLAAASASSDQVSPLGQNVRSLQNEKYGDINGEIAREQESLNKLLKDEKTLRTDITKRNKENLSLEKEITSELANGADLMGKVGSVETTKETKDALKELEIGFNQATKEAILYGASFDEMGTKAGLFKTAINALMEQGLKPNNAVIQSLKASYDVFAGTTLPNAGTAVQRFITQDLTALQEALQKAGAQPLPPIPVPVIPAPDFGAASTAWADFLEGLNANILKVDSLATSLGEMAARMVDSFSGALSGIASELGSGAMQLSSFGDALLNTLSELGKQAGAYFVKLGLPMMIAGDPRGGLLIAAGLALSAFSGSLGGKGGGSGGSMAPSVSGTGGGYQNPQMGTSYGNGREEVIFEIAGDTLRGVLDRNAYKRNRIGG